MVFNESANLDSKFDCVSDIVPGNENVCIKVRVIRLWKVAGFLNPSEVNSLEMVLVDEKGGKIHASVRKQLIYMFQSKIEEGNVYEMSYFSIFPQSGFYRTALHPYKIAFQMKTKVKLSESKNISEYGLTCTDIEEISGHTNDYEFLVDVIGVMTGMSAEREYIRDGKVTKMIVVELTDHSGKCECALFGDYAEELSKRIGKVVSGLPVVVIQFAKVKIFRGKASIQNVINTTRLLINPDIPEVETFKNKIAVHGIDIDSSVSLIGESAKPSADEEFLRLHPKKSVMELSGLSESGVVAVCADVVGIVDGNDWWYAACKCHKSVVPDSGAYFCASCDRHVFQVVPRFRVKLEVTDGKCTSVFVVFDSEMSYIMEKSCAFFVAQAKAKNCTPYPVEFDSLIGKRMLFAIDLAGGKVALADGSYRVKRVCCSPEIIKSFCLECPFSTPKKGMSNVVNLDSDAESGGTCDGDDLQSSEFVDDLIVSPPVCRGKDVFEDDVVEVVKKNLLDDFDATARGSAKVPLKKVKIEKN